MRFWSIQSLQPEKMHHLCSYDHGNQWLTVNLNFRPYFLGVSTWQPGGGPGPLDSHEVDIILTFATAENGASSPTQLLRAFRLARLTRMFRAFWQQNCIKLPVLYLASNGCTQMSRFFFLKNYIKPIIQLRLITSHTFSLHL